MEAGAGAEPRTRNQDSQHMLEQPGGYFPDPAAAEDTMLTGRIREKEPEIG